MTPPHVTCLSILYFKEKYFNFYYFRDKAFLCPKLTSLLLTLPLSSGDSPGDPFDRRRNFPADLFKISSVPIFRTFRGSIAGKI